MRGGVGERSCNESSVYLVNRESGQWREDNFIIESIKRVESRYDDSLFIWSSRDSGESCESRKCQLYSYF